ncbi:hypothetical protein WA026_007720 [Henosepilachna vigintioctopunctata]|uniref:Uncharacterized protein n=1 Tax=Henosepilachna vigintioctopunctata TaxID=420089 RepID=A0AAW1U7Q3_9CUCU
MIEHIVNPAPITQIQRCIEFKIQNITFNLHLLIHHLTLILCHKYEEKYKHINLQPQENPLQVSDTIGITLRVLLHDFISIFYIRPGGEGQDVPPANLSFPNKAEEDAAERGC